MSSPDEITASPDWSETEKWVWEQTREGKIADLNEHFGATLDPNTSEGWSPERRISPGFLAAVLLDAPYRDALTRQGVRIVGACFNDEIDLANAELGHEVWLDKSRIEKGANLYGLRSSQLFSWDGSWVGGLLNMENLRLDSSLLMREGGDFAEVILRRARIGRSLEMDGAKFTGKLNMDSVRVDSSLFMRKRAEFAEVILNAGSIGGTLSMIGSKFTGKLGMNMLQVDSSLFMRGSAEFAEVDLNSATIGGTLEMDGSRFTGKLSMGSLQVDSSLFMRKCAEFGKVNLNGATIGGTLEMDGSKFTGKLKMNLLQVNSSLFMRGGAEFAEVDLNSARIGGTLEMNGSKFTGRLSLEGSEVSRSLFLHGAELADLNLINAKVGHDLTMTGSRFAGEVNMEALQVGAELTMNGGEFSKRIQLHFSTIGTNLDLSGAGVTRIDLTGAKITNELRLGSESKPAVRWIDGGRLDLRNTTVGVLCDRKESWPEKLALDLTGFRPDQLSRDTASRPAKWFVDWLAKDELYAPQPYERLAAVLQQAGHSEKASTVLYAGKERERAAASRWRWLGLTLLKYTIGYGYGARYFLSLIWVALFVAVGALVLHATGEAARLNMDYGLSYSLDMLLPIIRLRPAHYTSEFDLAGLARYYFYVHQLLGYVLASFLLAGLAGITKR